MLRYKTLIGRSLRATQSRLAVEMLRRDHALRREHTPPEPDPARARPGCSC